MVRNEENYLQAVQLRERGFTLVEIARVCGVSKSTVSKWLKNNAISADVTKQNKRRAGQANAARLQLVNKARGSERATRYQEVLRHAQTEFKHYKTSPLFIAGLMLYVAHGESHAKEKIRFSTNNQQSHLIFLTFAREFLGAEQKQVRCWLQLYQSQTEAVCLKKWHKILKLPYQQFHRTQFLTRNTKKPLHCGVGNTIIGSTVLQRKLLHWVQLAQKELVK